MPQLQKSFKRKRLMCIWRNRLTILFSLFLSLGYGQEDARATKKSRKGEFNGLLRAGVVSSQIYGDNFGGYNKLGFTGGVGTYTRISNRFKFQIEINYATRGSRERSTKAKPIPFPLRLEPHYLDVPLILKTDISIFEVEFGLTNGFLLFHREWVGNSKTPTNQHVWSFNRYELAGNLGINTSITDKWVLNARFHYSLLPASGTIGNSGIALYGGAYNNAITLSLHRLLALSN